MRSARWIATGLILPAIWAAGPPEDKFRVDATMVVVNVSVTDTHDRPVAGLEQRQFRIFENGSEQSIAFFSHEDSPVSIGLIFDTSGSMDGKLKQAREMVGRFCQSLNPEDEMFLVTVRKTVGLAMNYTSNCGDIQGALMFSKAEGLTALLDAVPLALRHLKTAHNRRKAILLISDGGDNASRIHKGEIRRLVQEAGVPIYVAALARHTEVLPSLEEAQGPALLRDVVMYSGGRYWEIDDSRKLADAAAMMASEIHDQYVIGYRAPDTSRDGKYRKISVKVAREGPAPRLSVSFRSGYYAPAE